MSPIGIVGLLAATTADTVREKEVTPVVSELDSIILESLRGLLRYLWTRGCWLELCSEKIY